LPGVKRLGLLGDATDAGTKVEQEALASPAAAMGITIIHAEAASPGDCDGAIAALIVRRVDAICLLESALNFNMRSGVIELAYQKRVGTCDFPLTREALTHVMHALSLKSSTHAVFDWELAASAYDYRQDLARANTTPRPGSDTSGAGRLTDMKGSGWSTLALKGSWHPRVADGEHVADFGVQHERYALRNRVTTLNTDWTAQEAGPLSSRAQGTTTLNSVWAQHAWRISPAWKTVIGGRLERWTATDGLTQSVSPATTTSADCDESVLAGYCTRQHPI